MKRIIFCVVERASSKVSSMSPFVNVPINLFFMYRPVLVFNSSIFLSILNYFCFPFLLFSRRTGVSSMFQEGEVKG